jgi:transposase
MYYIGLDVHKKTISYWVKDASGQIHRDGRIGATRQELDIWMKTFPQPWTVGMEATIFTGWIYDHLLPHAQQIKVAHPLMLRAIAAAKKKNDRIDAGKIADCLRCDFLPECDMASTAIRDRRRTLRYRQLLMRQMVQMKNRISGLLLETGVSYDKQRLHKVKCFHELLTINQDIGESIRPLLKLSRETIVRLQKTLLPGHRFPPQKRRKCNPCVRCEMSPMCQAAHSGLAANTHSIFCDGSEWGPRQRMDVWFSESRNHRREAHLPAGGFSMLNVRALPSALPP